MKIKLLLVSILFVQLFSLWQWFGCANFADPFHYSAFDLQLRLIDGIHNDVGVPLQEVRLYHNKPVGFVFDIFNRYLQFWNITFLASFISVVGVVGLAAGLYFFFTKKKNRFLWLMFGYLLLAPFIEIFGFIKFPYMFRLILISASFILWSLFGYWNLLREKKISVRWIIVLLLVSLWYQLALPVMEKFCLN